MYLLFHIYIYIYIHTDYPVKDHGTLAGLPRLLDLGQTTNYNNQYM